MIWRDLSDSELRARLTQRGVPPARAAWLVGRRENPVEADEIARLLAR